MVMKVVLFVVGHRARAGESDLRRERTLCEHWLCVSERRMGLLSSHPHLVRVGPVVTPSAPMGKLKLGQGRRSTPKGPEQASSRTWI